MTEDVQLEHYAFRTSDKIRYGDTDRQGHVNNAVFATFLELGRVEALLSAASPVLEPGTALVIARLVIDFKAEITWPGEVAIATRVASVGRSSIKLEQGLFQHGRCAATAESVIVLTDEATRRSRPLSAAAAVWLLDPAPR
ncbi:acyl-CoA thioesterase [Methylocella silvestris]|uniref:Thioesterase n=1 Tax=Methylocella silvestris TaxID=199596 RepID=A0A2J7TE95_METSI|nr:acyl-CoA thioesterase [Methylocella silvestris]PNG25081.1 thioesterase [Methylocella silvestris]